MKPIFRPHKNAYGFIINLVKAKLNDLAGSETLRTGTAV